MSKILKGHKVILREKRIEDAVNDYTWSSDPELARLDAASPLKISFPEFMASHSEGLQYSSARRRRFAIETLDGKHIGNCTYYDIDERKGEAELGIMIGDRQYWNQGYGSDAVTTLVSHIFQETKLNRIYLSVLDWNIRAQKCFEKSGFVACHRTMRNRNSFIIMELRRNWLEKSSGEEKA